MPHFDADEPQHNKLSDFYVLRTSSVKLIPLKEFDVH